MLAAHDRSLSPMQSNYWRVSATETYTSTDGKKVWYRLVFLAGTLVPASGVHKCVWQ